VKHLREKESPSWQSWTGTKSLRLSPSKTFPFLQRNPSGPILIIMMTSYVLALIYGPEFMELCIVTIASVQSIQLIWRQEKQVRNSYTRISPFSNTYIIKRQRATLSRRSQLPLMQAKSRQILYNLSSKPTWRLTQSVVSTLQVHASNRVHRDSS
jgi:hypothetical protein